jgi:DNA-binding winged helix-turn-helix (wHTH) protein/TolB-like protein
LKELTNQKPERLYEFGPFRVHAVKRVLLRDGEVVPLTSKAFDTLLMLVEHSGKILGKDEMMSALWRDTIVEENNLTQHISTLRKALGERANEHRFVVTVPGRGYSFVAQVKELHEDIDSDLILQQFTRASITIVAEEQNHESNASKLRTNGYFPATVSSSDNRRRLVGAALASCVLLAGLVALFAYRGSAEKFQPDRTDGGKSIAILPFRSLNGPAYDDFLGPGMTDTLIAKLSNIQQVAVRPTSAVIKYAATNPDSLAVGRYLGVESVLEGTVQRSGDRVRVTVQLLRVRDGKPLWAQSFEERLTDIFTVQDAISEQVAQAMLVKLTGTERESLKKRYTENFEAYQAYLRGRHVWNKRSEGSLRRSIGYFQQATASDPSYALAYAGIADAYSLLAYYGFAPSMAEEHYQKAKAAALQALEIDGTLAEAHTSLALIKTYYEHDSQGGEKEYQRAIGLKPNYATARQWYSDFLAEADRPQEAMAEIKRAQQIDPLSPVINATVGERLLYAREYDRAIEQLLKTLEIDPDFFLARYLLALSYEQKGMYREAIAELTKAKEQFGDGVMYAAALGHIYAMSGDKAGARKILSGLLKTDPDGEYAIATIYAGLDEKQQAFRWLQRVHKKVGIGLLKTDPRLDNLRSDPKFAELLRG